MSHAATHDVKGFPGAGRIPVVGGGGLTEKGGSRGQAEGGLEHGYQQGHTAARLQPCPASARTAPHSPSPNIYDEAGRGILFGNAFWIP